MKQKIWFLVFLLSCLFGKAQAEEVNAMTLWMASGSQVTYLLDELPVVTFQGEDLVLTTHMNVITYAADDVCKFTYSYVDPDKVTSLQSAGVRFIVKDRVLTAYNLEPQSGVEVYSTGGILQAKGRSDRKGYAAVTLPAGANGVYVIKTSTANFKIRKP